MGRWEKPEEKSKEEEQEDDDIGKPKGMRKREENKEPTQQTRAGDRKRPR